MNGPNAAGSARRAFRVGNGYVHTMSIGSTVTVRMFGLLHSARSAAGLPSTVDVEIPDSGSTGFELARELELDVNLIEGVFVNRTVYGLDHPVLPGDRVAFVPYGTPGPHRFCLGLYQAGRDSHTAVPEDD